MALERVYISSLGEKCFVFILSICFVVIVSVSFVRSFVCYTKRPSVRQSIKLQVRSNLADLPRSASRCTPPELISSGEDEFKFGRSTPRSASRCTPPELTSSGEDKFKFGRSTLRSASRSTCLELTSSGEDEFKFGRSTPRSAGRSTP